MTDIVKGALSQVIHRVISPTQLPQFYAKLLLYCWQLLEDHGDLWQQPQHQSGDQNGAKLDLPKGGEAVP